MKLATKKTVLIVEDSKSERKLISALLEELQVDVIALDSAESAQLWLKENPLPSLILLDIVLPGQSGLDLCRQIRSHQEWKDIPILFCSSRVQKFDIFWAIRQGGLDYITKPYRPQTLIDTVCKHI